MANVDETLTPATSRGAVTVISCAECGGDLRGHTHCVALDKSWHIAHFKCAQCSCMLFGFSYFLSEGSPYCEGCFKQKLGVICKKCSQPLLLNTPHLRVGLDAWHIECLRCFSCHNRVIGEFGLLDDEDIICLECLDHQGVTKGRYTQMNQYFMLSCAHYLSLLNLISRFKYTLLELLSNSCRATSYF